MNRKAAPADDDCEIQKIEVEFAVPVYLRDTDFRDFAEVIDRIGEILQCDPIPACQRGDAQLEPPWEVTAEELARLQMKEKAK